MKKTGGSYTLRALTDRLLQAPPSAMRKPAAAVEEDLRRSAARAQSDCTLYLSKQVQKKTC